MRAGSSAASWDDWHGVHSVAQGIARKRLGAIGSPHASHIPCSSVSIRPRADPIAFVVCQSSLMARTARSIEVSDCARSTGSVDDTMSRSVLLTWAAVRSCSFRSNCFRGCFSSCLDMVLVPCWGFKPAKQGLRCFSLMVCGHGKPGLCLPPPPGIDAASRPYRICRGLKTVVEIVPAASVPMTELRMPNRGVFSRLNTSVIQNATPFA